MNRKKLKIVRRVPTLKVAIAIASMPVTNAVAAAMTKDIAMLVISTPPKICVAEKIGMPLMSSAMTKNNRLSSEPRTIWALESGVASRMSYVWLSFSWVMAPAVKMGASSRHQAKLEIAHLPENIPAGIGEVGQAGRTRAAAAEERKDDEQNEQAKINAANGQVALALAAGLDDPKQDRVGREKSPEIVAYAEHIRDSRRGNDLPNLGRYEEPFFRCPLPCGPGSGYWIGR